MCKVKFLAESNHSLVVEANNVRDCIKTQRSEQFKSFQPLAFKTDNGLLYYYDENIVSYYVQSEEMSFQELAENTNCEALYRNTTEVVTDDHYTIDKGYLWKQMRNTLVLVNDDHYVESEYDEKVFVKIM